jgi:hypothetical protein
MLKNKKHILLIVFSLNLTVVTAQTKGTQVIRGKIVEMQTQMSIEFANVWTVIDSNLVGTITDTLGNFKLSNIPVGRYEIYVKAIGYEDIVINNVLVSLGKEVVLNIGMTEKIITLSEVGISATTDKDQAINNMAIVSARILSSEEAGRYAGSWSDVGRMVSNFAGVIAANDQRNDIIIRGNSPMGLLWKLDGFEIPNPNHFGAMGGTGGPVGMLNNNQLANSDFYTGAFPAEIGNALAGAFDLRLRNGNNQKHEFLGALGFNGVELGAEGPFSKETGASYMINARYSFLQILEAIGLNIGGVPQYQDVTAKANIPLKRGNLSIIGLVGLSKINIKSEMSAEEGWLDGDLSEDIHMRNQQYFTGVNYMVRLNDNTRLENRLSYQYFNSKVNMDMLSYPTLDAEPYLKSGISEGRISYISTVYHRVNTKNFLQGGLGISVYQTHFDETYYSDTTVSKSVKLRDASRNSLLLNGYLQWQYRFTNALKLVSGVYSQFYLFNRNIWAEPRLGLKWTVSKRSSINVGLGLHSQLQPRQVYFYEQNGTLPNRNLSFSKSGQAVLGYDLKITQNLRFKTEIYYQYLFDIPVMENIPQESILNMGDDYYNSWDNIFVNKGTGENYGIEMTIEKFFHKGYYFLVTGSLYNATYRGYDKVKRNTKFSGNYSVNVIGGYEWKLWKTLLLSINVKSVLLGNKRILPTTASQRGMTQIIDYNHAYEEQYPLYFRSDLNIAVKLNIKKVAMEWFFEMENITNHKNIQRRIYNQSREIYEYTYQTGLMPMGGFKIYF